MNHFLLFFRIAMCVAMLFVTYTPTLVGRCCGSAADVAEFDNPAGHHSAATGVMPASQPSALSADERKYRHPVVEKTKALIADVKIIALLRHHKKSIFFEKKEDQLYLEYTKAEEIRTFLRTNTNPPLDAWKNANIFKNIADWEDLYKLISDIETHLYLAINYVPEVTVIGISDIFALLAALETKFPMNANATAALPHTLPAHPPLTATAASSSAAGIASFFPSITSLSLRPYPSSTVTSNAMSAALSRYQSAYSSLPASASATPFTGPRSLLTYNHLPPIVTPATSAAAATPSQQHKQLNS